MRAFSAGYSGDLGPDLPDPDGSRDLQRVPRALADAAGTGASREVDSNAPPILIIVAMMIIYILLGCVMDALAMVLLTMPVFYPIVASLDLG